MPLLLEKLAAGRSLKGAVVTIDAIACNPWIAQSIRDAGADYLLAVKGNQPALQADIAAAFDAADKGQVEVDVDLDKGHGRIETRTVSVLRQVDWLDGDRRFPGEVPSAGEGLSRRGGLPAKRSRRTPHLLPLQDIGRAKGRQNLQRDRTALPRSFAEGPAPWASSRTEPQWIASSPPSSHTKTKCRESQPFSP